MLDQPMRDVKDQIEKGEAVRIDLLLDSAAGVIDEIRSLSSKLSLELDRSTGLDEVINILEEKRRKVEVLRDLASEIRIALNVDSQGRPRRDVSNQTKAKFVNLVREFRELISAESEFEKLLCGRGIPLIRRRKQKC